MEEDQNRRPRIGSTQRVLNLLKLSGSTTTLSPYTAIKAASLPSLIVFHQMDALPLLASRGEGGGNNDI
jgi:hypothetical protein